MSAMPYVTNVPCRSLPKGLAVASLVLGLVGILGSLGLGIYGAVASLFLGPFGIQTAFILLGGLLGLTAVIVGFVALGKIKKGEADGKGLAIGGIVTGAVALLLTILLLVTVGAFLADKKELSDLSDCVNNAQANAQAERSCLDEFSRQIKP